jgi:hypothetical protein
VVASSGGKVSRIGIVNRTQKVAREVSGVDCLAGLDGLARSVVSKLGLT